MTLNKRRLPALFVGLLLIAVVAACGGGSPTSPSSTVPNYAGNWTGTYTITGCTQSGGIALANICGSLGSTPPYSFALTESSRNVSGTFTLGSVTFPGTGGTIASDGSLALNATTVTNGVTVVVNWNLNIVNNALRGTITQMWTSDTLSGQVNVTGTINNSTR